MSWPFEAIRWFPVNLPKPAAGAEIALTPNQQGFWRVWSICATLTTSAAIPVRTPEFRVNDGNGVFWRQAAPAVIGPAATVNFTAFEGANPNVGANGLVTLCWPQTGLYLRQGDVLSSLTANLDVADQWSNIVAMVQELPSGPDYRLLPAQETYVEPLSI